MESSLPHSSPRRPGRVTRLRGIIFQSDLHSLIGVWIIRPVEMFDRWMAGLRRRPGSPPLAIHAGLHVDLDDGREYVVEQLFGTPRENFVSGLNWTPVETFRARDHGGWDVTVPATAFRGIDEAAVEAAVDFLNRIEGRPFFGEDCTSLVERTFNERRLFADSPTARIIGLGGLRVGDPALPLLRPEARLPERAERLLRADTLRNLPDPELPWDAPSTGQQVRMFWLGMAWAAVVVTGGVALGLQLTQSLNRRRPARRFRGGGKRR